VTSIWGPDIPKGSWQTHETKDLAMELIKLLDKDISSCPACGSFTKKPWFHKEIAGVRFNLDKCGSCGTAYVNPPPSAESLKTIYASTGHGSKSLTSFEKVMAAEVEFPNSTVDANRMVGYAKQLLGPVNEGQAHALDIGSGYGFFSRAALEQGFRVTAVNPATAENRIFQQLNGFEPIPLFFEEVDFGPEKFDLVILSQVLEHLLDPFQVLVKVRSLLKPKGVLTIAVPNVDAILIKILRAKSSFLGLPEHIIHFSRRGLRAILQRSGFDVNLHRYISRIPYNSISNKLNIHGKSRILLNYCVRISQWAPLSIANWLGLGLYQNVWALPVRQGQ
jgi:2-polyprenyl-3-methyl-5-hydroxy-6-metoxy-1,4-benzoquinol methylase